MRDFEAKRSVFDVTDAGDGDGANDPIHAVPTAEYTFIGLTAMQGLCAPEC
jgi:hypothetical protein